MSSTVPPNYGGRFGMLRATRGELIPVMTSALVQMDPFNFTAIRYTIAAIPFAVLLLAREGKGAFNLKGERHLLAWLFGTAGFAGFGFLMFLGQQMAGPTGALSAAIMTATMPLLALPVNWVMRESPYRYTAMTTLLGLVSVYAINVVLIELRYIPVPSSGQAWPSAILFH